MPALIPVLRSLYRTGSAREHLCDAQSRDTPSGSRVLAGRGSSALADLADLVARDEQLVLLIHLTPNNGGAQHLRVGYYYELAPEFVSLFPQNLLWESP